MRKRIMALLLVLGMLLGPAAVFAGETAENNPASGTGQVVIDDDGGFLNESERAEILAEMEKIAPFCDVGLFIDNGTSHAAVLSKAKDWADRVFPEQDECVVFVIDMATRYLGLSSTDGIRKTLSAAKANLICDNVSGLAKNGRYAECAKEAFRQVYTTLNGGKVTSVMKYIGNALMAVAGAILLAYLLISARVEQEVRVSLPGVVTATAGVGAAIMGRQLTKVVHHESSHSGGGHGGGCGGGGGGGGHSMGGGSHGF